MCIYYILFRFLKIPNLGLDIFYVLLTSKNKYMALIKNLNGKMEGVKYPRVDLVGSKLKWAELKV